jgi:hypothetical protein
MSGGRRFALRGAERGVGEMTARSQSEESVDVNVAPLLVLRIKALELDGRLRTPWRTRTVRSWSRPECYLMDAKGRDGV